MTKSILNWISGETKGGHLKEIYLGLEKIIGSKLGPKTSGTKGINIICGDDLNKLWDFLYIHHRLCCILLKKSSIYFDFFHNVKKPTEGISM